jgi:hypothetical protein
MVPWTYDYSALCELIRKNPDGIIYWRYDTQQVGQLSEVDQYNQ